MAVELPKDAAGREVPLNSKTRCAHTHTMSVRSVPNANSTRGRTIDMCKDIVPRIRKLRGEGK